MKDALFSFIWAGLCSVGMTNLMKCLFIKLQFMQNTEVLQKMSSAVRFDLYQIFSWLRDFLSGISEVMHSYGCVTSYVCLLGFMVLFLLTGLHKHIGYLLFLLIGFVGFLFMVFLILAIGYALINLFFSWVV